MRADKICACLSVLPVLVILSGAAQAADTGQQKPALEKYARAPADRLVSGRHVSDFTTADFSGPHHCFNCHHLLTDAAGNRMSIIDDWRSTMMANAAKDPFWQAKVQSEVRRNPGIAEIIEKKCSQCHMPMAWTEAMVLEEYGEPAVLDEGFLNRQHRLHEAAMDGVSCTLCHQIRDQDLGTAASFSGNFRIDTTTEPPDRIIYGPYRDPVENPMRTSVGYTPKFGPQTNDAALCGTCHTLFTPYLDSSGRIAGQFPEQAVYLEWRHSRYGVPSGSRYDIGENPGPGRICQECHMPHSPAGPVIIANWAPDEVEPKDHFSQHFFVGGNVFMQEIFRDNSKELGLTASSTHLDLTASRSMDLLRNEGARLRVSDTVLRGNSLSARIRVDNLAGHKFPGGFPSRRLWLHVTVEDGTGTIIFESGRPRRNGSISGNDNDEDPAAFEPHYTEITRSDQVQIYEAVMRNTDQEVTYTLMRAAGYAKDNRLLPEGFDKRTASPDIAVYGEAMRDDDFRGGSDEILYRVDIGNHQGPFTFRAELLYATISYAFLQDLKKDEDLDLVGRFIRMTDRADMMPILVAAAAVEVK